ncbi:arylsulfatase [Parabacteroides faecis]|uniref:Arylsulfatase A-like enzyme n=1 Tax=Parabacteroides faecis TaxID=1217282 RepID=A0ABR6KG60_9BACT|nr:arylsulfatase [Parabacteroides faecis]MBB4620495.1 arylsulfatase A-like enzyme [Parabacteroides faecis]GGK05259.1 arylsulfatase [Parabacteroides faecis]
MKTQLVLCIGGTLLTGFSACKKEAPAEGRPVNVIYILADDLGYGDIGCYGQQKIKTPNIDRMAQEGMLFTQHYAGCTVSAPSRCSLMTGLHTGHSQIRGNKEIKPEGQQPMTEDTYTLGKLMKSAGYTTGIFGKWGLGYPGSTSVPANMGFDEFFGYNCQRQAHSYYPDHLWHNNDTVFLHENDNEGRKIYSQDLIHEQALKFIRDNKDKPFYAMLTYTLPHAELNLPHDSIYQMYENAFEEVPYDGKMGYHPSEKPYASFAAMVTRLDKYVGDVMAELKELGLDKNTIVIFTSDNGPHREGGANPDYFRSYGPLKGVKRDVYEGGIRVPMIAWGPEKIKAGVKSEHISAFWDVMPTLAELTGVTLPEAGDGISFLPTLLSEGEQKQHDYLYWEFHELNGREALRSGNWKLIRQPVVGETILELYDLSSDIHEDNNLSQQNPEKVKELEVLMDGARTESPLFNFGK